MYKHFEQNQYFFDTFLIKDTIIKNFIIYNGILTDKMPYK
jgi:hypothetical protein